MDNRPPIIETKNYRKPKRKKKKIVIAAASVISVLALTLTLVSLLKHEEHTFGMWMVTLEASCTENGVLTRSCKCGATETQQLMALGHSEEIDEGYSATRESDGLTHGSHCSVCGEILVEQKVIGAGSQGLVYKAISETECVISGLGTCADTELIIPAYMDGLAVTGIAVGAFDGCTSVSSVAVPEGVAEIDNYAFRGCSNLKTAVLPESLELLGWGAFESCSSLEIINIPEKITYIDGYIFAWCGSLKEIKLHSGIKSIGTSAFQKCESITSIIIPAGIEKIDNYAFSECNGLADMVYPGTLSEWDEIEKGEMYMRDWGFYTLSCSDAAVSMNGMTRYVERYYSQGLSYTLISDSACEISGAGSFTGSELIIPKYADGYEVVGIADNAFEGCDFIKSVEMFENISYIGEYAFSGCTDMKEIVYRGTAQGFAAISKADAWDKNIGDYVNYCTDAMISSDGSITYYSEGLEISVVSPDSCELIGFGQCTDKNVVVPRHFRWIEVKGVRESAFYGNATVESITLLDGIEAIEKSAFSNCDALKSVYINTHVQNIGENCFAYNDALEEVVIRGGTDVISNGAFSNCPLLKRVDIGAGVTSIEQYAFMYCESLVSITLPESMTKIEENAFYGCESLTDIYYKGTVEEWDSVDKSGLSGIVTSVHCANGDVAV